MHASLCLSMGKLVIRGVLRTEVCVSNVKCSIYKCVNIIDGFVNCLRSHLHGNLFQMKYIYNVVSDA